MSKRANRPGGRALRDGRVAPIAAGAVASIVVDLQNDFCSAGGALARTGMRVEPLNSVIPAVNRLNATLRAAGAPVIFLRAVYSDADGTVRSRVMAEQAERRWKGRGGRVPFVRQGHWGSALHPDLEVRPGDRVCTKRSYNGFHANNLGRLLRAARVDMVVVMGVTTDICVLFTAQAAFERGYRVLVPRDCVAAYDDLRHRAALRVLDHAIGHVCDSRAVVAALDAETGVASTGRR